MSVLTTAQLTELQGYVSIGNRSSYWRKLAEFQTRQGQDNRYALLALGVAEDDTASGKIANKYLRYIADQENVTITSGDEYDIGVNLIEADLAARNNLNGANIGLNDIRIYHVNIFDDYSLPAKTWTAYNILEALGDGAWNDILNAKYENNWLNFTSVDDDASITSRMIFAYANSDPDAQTWVEDMFYEGVLFDALSKPIPSPVVGTIDPDGIVAGTSGNDTVIGASENNAMYGFQGNDTFEELEGSDYIHGGNGTDTAVYVGNRADYSIAYGGKNIIYVIDNVGDEGSDTLIEVEKIQFADGVYQNGRFTPDVPRTPVADDDTSVVGINGSVNIDVLDNDYDPDDQDLTIALATGPTHGDVTLNLNGTFTYEPDTSYSGEDLFTYTITDEDSLSVTATVNIVVGSNVILGTNGNNTLSGNSSANTIMGLKGNDTIDGGGGADRIFGGDGNDILEGGSGNDLIKGGAGNDIFNGNDGIDNYVGGSGSDKYYFDMSVDSGEAGIIEDDRQGSDAIYLDNTTGGDRILFWYDSSNDQLNVEYHENPTGGADFSFAIQADNALAGTGVEYIIIDGRAFSTKNIIHAADHESSNIFTFDIDDYETNGYPALLSEDGNAVQPMQDTGYGYQMFAGLGGASSSVTFLVYADEIFQDFVAPSSGGSPNGSSSAPLDGYINTLILHPGFTKDNVRLTVDNSDNAQLIVHLDTVDVDYVFTTFEDGYTITGYAFTGTSESVSQVEEGTSSRLEIHGDDLEFSETTSTSTFYFENIYFSTGAGTLEDWDHIDLLGVIEFEGTDNGEELYGINRAEIIYGYDGEDTITSKEGDDVLIGGAGDDNLYGGTGDDTYNFDASSDIDTITESENEGLDTIAISGIDPENTRLYTAGNGYFYVANKDDAENYVIVYGGTTSESGTNSENTIGSYLEQISFDDGTIWNLAIGLKLEGISDDDSIYGSAYDDEILGMDGADNLFGNRGNDILNGGAGDDNLYGGVGDDVYIFEAGMGADTGVENPDAGIDAIFVNGIDPEDIRLTTDGSGNFYVISKDDPDDYMKFYVGTTNESGTSSESDISQYLELVFFDYTTSWTLTEGLSLEGSSDADSIFGTAFDDEILGMAGADDLTGNRGNDTLNGGVGNDTLYGGAGDDTYVFEAGMDIDIVSENAGAGDDTIFVSGLESEDIRMYTDGSGYFYVASKTDPSDYITFYAGTSGASGTSSENTVEDYIEQILFEDTTTWDLTDGVNLEGSSSGDSIFGTALNDEILGMAGNDDLTGNRGNDILNGGVGNDTLYGGAGDDTYVFEAGADADLVYENATSGADTVFVAGLDPEDVRLYTDSSGYLYVINKADPSDNMMLYASITGASSTVSETDVGEYFEEILFEDTTSWDLTNGLVLEGNSLADAIYGSAYNDTLYGLSGNDYIYGNRGNDTLIGGDTSDVLYGGAGNDALYGSDGLDSLTGDAGADTFIFEAASAFNDVDVIVDFSTGDSDKLNIADIIDGYYNYGTDVITDFVLITDNGTDTTVAIDQNGGANNFVTVATLYGVTGLTNEISLETAGTLITV